ncbi:helix-turn-helix domain-containing protein [Peptoniphilaceae bacterium SGI.097]
MKTQDIGKMIQRKRLENGMTKKELAEKIGLSSTTIYYIEIGRNKPLPKNAKKLGEVLGFDHMIFFEDE